jgi:NADPH:quinone reductase
VESAVHEVLPGGVDVAFDGLGGPRTGECIRALRRGGLVVGYGFMAVHGTINTLQGFVSLFLGARLSGRRDTFYAIPTLYRKNKRPFKEDLPKLFELLATRGGFSRELLPGFRFSPTATPSVCLKREALSARSFSLGCAITS